MPAPVPRERPRYHPGSLRRPRQTRTAPAADPTTRGLGWLQQLAAVVAPSTVATALLGYFGYLATRARFQYFGVYLDLVDLSTHDLLLYGSEVVYVPVTLTALALLVAVGARLAGQRLLDAEWWTGLAGWVTAAGLLAGVLLLVRGVVGILAPDRYQPQLPVMTPLSLSLGALFLRQSLGSRLAARWLQPWDQRLVAAGRIATAVLLVAGLFWIANGFAARYGLGRALDDAAGLPSRPELVLDTKEPLDAPPGVTRTPIAAGPFKYRYEGLRLLVESGGRLFLVPAYWTPGTSRTLVVDFTPDVRIQLVPH